jgi:hypothetical protein
MTLECASRVFDILFRINVQHDLSYLAPISAIGIRIKQPQIGNEMNQIILRYPWFGRGNPVHVWIKLYSLHRLSLR